MTQDTNKENKQLDYGFITNQPGSSEKPKDKKLLIVLILGIVSILMIIILALATNSSVKETKTTVNEQIPEKHLRLISQNKISEAIGLYKDKDKINNDLYKTIWVDNVFAKFDLTKCTITNKELKENEVLYKVKCPILNSSDYRELTYSVDKNSGLINGVSDESNS